MPNESPTGMIRTVYNFYECFEKDNSIPQYDLEMQHISDADKCKLAFDNHFDNIVRRSRTYSNQHDQKS